MSKLEEGQFASPDIPELASGRLEGPGYRGMNPIDVEETAERLLDKGVIFQRVPREIYPDMPYTTVDALADSGATLYSGRHINRLISNGTIPAIDFNGKLLLTPESVDLILKLQTERLAREPDSSMMRPGPRSVRKPRLKRYRTSNNH